VALIYISVIYFSEYQHGIITYRKIRSYKR